MNKKELKEFKKIYKNKLPRHSTIVIECKGRNFDKVTEKLNKPFDRMFTTIMGNTCVDVAQRIDGCSEAFVQHDEMVFILRNSGDSTSFLGNDVQRLCSYVAANASTIFYTNFLSMVMDYSEKIRELFEENTEGFDESLIERRDNLASVYLQLPTFEVSVYAVPSEDEEDILEIKQNVGIDKSIQLMANVYLTEPTTGKNRDVVLRELYKAGHRWEDLDNEDKFGAYFMKKGAEWDSCLLGGELAVKLTEEEEKRKARKENTEKEGE